jgi:ribosomal protein S18 acetylase RimI-like enzyme
MVSTRPATADDAATLATLAAATFGLACPPGTTQADIDAFIAEHFTLEHFEEYLRSPDRAVRLLLAGDGTAVGYTMLVFGEPTDPDVLAVVTHRPTVELSKLYVLPDGHGGGVARVLMEATLDDALEHGASSVWLGVNQQNARAIRFYEKSGFTVAGRKTFLVGSVRHDDFVMERVSG